MTREERLAIIETVVRRLGLNGTYQGMMGMVHGVDLAYDQPRILSAVTKELYPEIARRVGGTGKTVERNLRTAATACWKIGDRDFLDEIAGFPLQEPPTSGELIDYLVYYIRREHLLEEPED